MKIKKFTATTEQEAIEMVKNELGLSALVINIKRIQPKGFFAFFKKPAVEVTAAYEEEKMPALKSLEAIEAMGELNEEQKSIVAAIENMENKRAQKVQKASDNNNQDSAVKAIQDSLKDAQAATEINAKDEKIQMLQDMLLTTSDMLSRAQNQLSVSRFKDSEERLYQNNLLQIFYNTLIENEVNGEIAREILDEMDQIEQTEKLDINFVVKIVYNSIVKIIGDPEGLKPVSSKGNPQIFAFMGPTGVGKTTTIAKLTADLSLNRGMDVGLITADTYRIAAIEQLKTYGDILGIDVAVAYKPEDLAQHLETHKNLCDIILVDTAGRSHKNKENLEELSEYLLISDKLEKFLVLSLTTKFEDMLDIVNTFSAICDFKIIFTKMDETSKLGNIANICYRTGKKLSYITFGQNVPDDIKTIAPNEVAMRLLGLGEDDGPSQ